MLILAVIAGMLLGGSITLIVQHRYHLRLERELVSRLIEKAGARPLDVPPAPPQEPAPKKPSFAQRLRFKV